MSAKQYLAVAACVILQGCATITNDPNLSSSDPSKMLPPPAAGMPTEPKTLKSEQDATKALTGYNYGLASQSDGSVQAFVSGLAGSGADNPITQNLPLRGYLLGDGQTNQTVLKASDITDFSIGKSGQAAIDAFNEEQLDNIASRYDMTTQRLKELLLSDSTVHINKDGFLMYVEKQMIEKAPLVSPSSESNELPVNTDSLDGVDVTRLHSRHDFSLFVNPGCGCFGKPVKVINHPNGIG